MTNPQERAVQQKARRRLTVARRSSGLTRRQLAQRLGRPVSFVDKIEGGQRPIRLREFGEIANALDLDPGELLQKIVG